MSLFDDDFFSTKVSKRASREIRRKKFSFPYRIGNRNRNWTNVRIVLVSSLTGAAVAIFLFGLIYGENLNGGSKAVSTAAGTSQTVDPLERTIMASAKIKPAVVSIINEQMVSYGLGGDKSTDGKVENGMLREAGVGSGFIFEVKAGKALIVTNYHVIADAHTVKAVLTSGETLEARVIGKDQITDLAVLEIDGKGIETVAELGDSSALRAAEFVMAIGNPLGMGESITMGVVSVIREVVPVSLNQNGVYDWEQEVIRVDAAINQGNSGGPLIDLNGRVVGINSMKIADFGVESIGYAIPINNAVPIIESLIEKGYVPRPYLGVYTLDLEQYWEQQYMQDAFGKDGQGKKELDDDSAVENEAGKKRDGEPQTEDDDTGLKLPDEVFSGVIVLEAVGPAKDAGLVFNDVIVKLDRKSIGSTMELRKYLYSEKKIGEEIEVTFYRDGEQKTTKFKLGENGVGE